jgi:hypothetical protein
MKTYKQLREELDDFEYVTEYVEFTEEEWNDLSIEDQDLFEDIPEGITVEEFMSLEGFKAMNKMKRKKMQRNKDLSKFKDRGKKLKAKQDRKKGGTRIKLKKQTKKRKKKYGHKMKMADKAFGHARSKFTK